PAAPSAHASSVTEGHPVVTDEAWAEGAAGAAELLAGLEALSEHPLAEAVVTRYGQPAAAQVSGFRSLTGLGLTGTVGGETYYAGSERLLRERGIVADEALEARAAAWTAQAATVIWLADSRRALGVVAVADTVKAGTAEAVRQLREAGIEVYMLTGDNEATAKEIASRAGIVHYRAGVLPDGK